MEVKPKIIDTYPLSPIQLGIVFESLVSSRPVYLQQHILTIHKELCLKSMQAALDSVTARHPILRSAIIPSDTGEYRQAVYDRIQVPIIEINLSNFEETAQFDQIQHFLESDREQRFVLENAPLFRACLLTLNPSDHHLVLTFHHAIIDARSFMIFINELFLIYEAKLEGQEPELSLPVPYREYVDWMLQEDFFAAEYYWRENLKGISSSPQVELANMSFDRTAESGPDDDQATEARTTLSRETSARLVNLCADNQVTLNTILQAAWGVLLSRYSRNCDIIFGATRSCRHSALNGNTDSLMGPILNTLPLRMQIDPNKPVMAFLQELRQNWVAMSPFENTPLAKIADWSGSLRGRPLFDTIFNFSNEDFTTQLHALAQGKNTHSVDLHQQSDYALSFSIVARPDISIRLTYDNHRFGRTAVECMLNQLSSLLENISLLPESKIGNLSLLSESERQQILYAWNTNHSDISSLTYFWSRINAHAAAHPGHPAVIEGWINETTGEPRSITYRQLTEESNRLARYLLDIGAGPEVRIGICMERSIEYVIAFLAVLKSGSVYVALDPDLPQKRLAYIVAETQLKIVLSHSSLIDRIPDQIVNLLFVDQLEKTVAERSPKDVAPKIDPYNLAYIIYTSGSTGQPKGVMITQQGLCSLLVHFLTTYELNPEDKLLVQTPISFDPSIYDPLVPLLFGATMVMVSPGQHADIDYVIDTTVRMEITVWHLVTSIVNAVMDHPKCTNCKSVRLLMTGGESMPGDLPGKIARRLGIRSTNSYGPAENCIRSTSIYLPSDGFWPFNSIGKPIENTKVYILDEMLNPQPPGVIGEIYLGGSNVARGYCRQPGLTAERFIPNPFGQPGERIYRAGDLGRYHLDGQIEFLGRVDNQIKLRGVRIELEEIEHLLNMHPMIARSGVTLREGNTGPYLAAFIQPASMDKLDLREIRAFLRARLPDNSIPASFQILVNLPRLPSGKLNRQALTEIIIEESNQDSDYQSPKTALEVVLAGVFEHVLGAESIGLQDNFFNLGGHSLLVMKTITQINELFRIRLPLRALFDAPSVAEMRDLLLVDSQEAERIEKIAQLALEFDDKTDGLLLQ